LKSPSNEFSKFAVNTGCAQWPAIRNLPTTFTTFKKFTEISRTYYSRLFLNQFFQLISLYNTW